MLVSSEFVFHIKTILLSFTISADSFLSNWKMYFSPTALFQRWWSTSFAKVVGRKCDSRLSHSGGSRGGSIVPPKIFSWQIINFYDNLKKKNKDFSNILTSNQKFLMPSLIILVAAMCSRLRPFRIPNRNDLRLHFRRVNEALLHWVTNTAGIFQQ